jgi:hypothetical protein
MSEDRRDYDPASEDGTPAGGPRHGSILLGLGISIAVGLLICGFPFLMAGVDPSQLTFLFNASSLTLIAAPILLVVGIVLVIRRRTRRTGGGIFLGAGVAIVIAAVTLPALVEGLRR